MSLKKHITDIRQSPQWIKYCEELGFKSEKKDGIYFLIRKLPLLGNVIKIQRPPKPITEKLVSFIIKKYKPFRVYYEPDNTYTNDNNLENLIIGKYKFKVNNSPFLPTKTIIIDLKQSLEDLLSQTHSKTRYNIKYAEKKNNIKIIGSDDIEKFTNLWHKWHKKRFFLLSQKKLQKIMYKSFGKNAKIFFAMKEDEVISILMTLDFDSKTYYMFAATSELGKKLFAPTLLTWEAIKTSKKNKNKQFDFDGIYDERFPIDSWKGFTKFKKGFHGIIKAYSCMYKL